MSEETEDTKSMEDMEESDGAVAKPRFKITMPSPIVYFFIGPFALIFIVYIVLSRMLIVSDLDHEEKLKQLLESKQEQVSTENNEETNGDLAEGEGEASFLDTHNYFQFPMSFAVNIPNTKKNLTFDLAVSSFQSGVTAEWFFESFKAFVPALRSDILYYMGGHSFEDLQLPEFQAKLLKDLREVINDKLESLGAKPEISKVLFVRFVMT